MDLPTCTVCGQPILEAEELRRNLIGARHAGTCPTEQLLAAVRRWADANPRLQPPLWRDVVSAVRDLDATRHLVGLAGRTVAVVQLGDAAGAARNAPADWRRRGETDRTHASYTEARGALLLAARREPAHG